MRKNDKDVEVQSSPISGRGLYALRDFKKGEVVLSWDTAHKVRNSDLESVNPAEQHFLNPFDSEHHIILQSPERFMNHSCDSNTQVQNFQDVAIRDIRQTEEITSDYRTGGVEIDFDCRCGSPNCISKLTR